METFILELLGHVRAVVEDAAVKLDDNDFAGNGLSESAFKFAVIAALPIAINYDPLPDGELTWDRVASELALKDDPNFGTRRVVGFKKGQLYADLVLGHPRSGAGVDAPYLDPVIIELKYVNPTAIRFSGNTPVAARIRDFEDTSKSGLLKHYRSHVRYNPFRLGFSACVAEIDRQAVRNETQIQLGTEVSTIESYLSSTQDEQIRPYLRDYAKRSDVMRVYGGRRVHGVTMCLVADRVFMSDLMSNDIEEEEEDSFEQNVDGLIDDIKTLAV